jgi:hypothetical protein
MERLNGTVLAPSGAMTPRDRAGSPPRHARGRDGFVRRGMLSVWPHQANSGCSGTPACGNDSVIEIEHLLDMHSLDPGEEGVDERIEIRGAQTKTMQCEYYHDVFRQGIRPLQANICWDFGENSKDYCFLYRNIPCILAATPLVR